MQSCCSPIASIRFKLLFPVSVRFSCCPPIASLQLLLATCVRFSCSSPISTATRLRPLRLLLPYCVCCSPIVSVSRSSPIASACSLTSSGRFQPMPNVLEVQYIEGRRSRVTSLVPPHEHPTSVTRTRTRIKI